MRVGLLHCKHTQLSPYTRVISRRSCSILKQKCHATVPQKLTLMETHSTTETHTLIHTYSYLSIVHCLAALPTPDTPHPAFRPRAQYPGAPAIE